MCRYAKVPVLQGIMGLLEGSMLLAGRHVAGEESGEEYRSGFSGERVRGRRWCRIARRVGVLRGIGGPDRALGAGHRSVG